jgi:hypothetical protein
MPAEPGSTITAWAVFSAIGGSLIGSTIGGCVSWLLHRKSLAAAKAQRDADRLEVRKALGYALLFKLIRLASDLRTLGKTVRSILDYAKSQGFAGAAWQVVPPIVPLPDAVVFAPEEMALVLSFDRELFNDMAALDQLHKSTVGIFELYNSRRNAVMERFGAEVKGTIGTTFLTPEDKRWLDPRAVELSSLVDAMLQRTEHDGQEAVSAMERFRGVLEREYKLKLKLEYKE